MSLMLEKLTLIELISKENITGRVFGRKLLSRKFVQNAQMVASVSVSGFLENGANLRCGSNHVFTKFLFARNVFCAQNAEMRKIPISFASKMRNCSKSNSAFHAKSGIA